MREMTAFEEANSKDSKVWGILKKEVFTEEGQREVVKLFDFMEKVSSSLGQEDTKRLYKYWNEHSHETFRVLQYMAYEKDKGG